MKPSSSHEKKAILYAITDTDGTPLDLMNIQSFKDGVLDSVVTFIGKHDRDEYVQVAKVLDLSAPGTGFDYRSFVRQQACFLGQYLRAYHRALAGKVYRDGHATYVEDRELSPEDELIEALRLFHTQR
jgi:hypothetical protein